MAEDIASNFVNTALQHVGEHGSDWTWQTYGMSNIEWCAAFVCAVAKTVGIANKCIAYTASATELGRSSTNKGFGTYYEGPNQGGQHTPVKGDLIFFRYNNRPRADKFTASHVGIVTDVDGGNVRTVEGNTGTRNKHTSIVKQKSYSLGTTTIGGYFHPNWSLVGGVDPSDTSSSNAGGSYTSDLYSSSTSRRDMTVREIGYLDDELKPSITQSDIKLSAINYTSMLASMFKLVAPIYVGGASYNTDALTGNCKVVVDYLLNKGLNAAAACGIAGNIYHESGFRTNAVGDHNTSFGICQWHNARGDSMKKVAGSSWATNLSGQLEYLWIELSTVYRNTVLSPLQRVSDDVEGCKQAADIFVRKFEIPSNVDVKSIQRQATAVEYFNKIVIVSTSPSSSGQGAELHTQSGQVASIVRTIEVPSNVRQTGVIRNYTNYTYFYNRWSRRSIQRTLADIWNQQGRPSSGNIATISGYYLLAMSPIFASTGEIVSIELANGQVINAILGDAKGADAASPWGHVIRGAVDIIEWESIGPGQSGSTRIDLGSWEGQKVIRVHNRGTYLR